MNDRLRRRHLRPLAKVPGRRVVWGPLPEPGEPGAPGAAADGVLRMLRIVRAALLVLAAISLVGGAVYAVQASWDPIPTESRTRPGWLRVEGEVERGVLTTVRYTSPTGSPRTAIVRPDALEAAQPVSGEGSDRIWMAIDMTGYVPATAVVWDPVQHVPRARTREVWSDPRNLVAVGAGGLGLFFVLLWGLLATSVRRVLRGAARDARPEGGDEVVASRPHSPAVDRWVTVIGAVCLVVAAVLLLAPAWQPELAWSPEGGARNSDAILRGRVTPAVLSGMFGLLLVVAAQVDMVRPVRWVFSATGVVVVQANGRQLSIPRASLRRMGTGRAVVEPVTMDFLWLGLDGDEHLVVRDPVEPGIARLVPELRALYPDLPFGAPEGAAVVHTEPLQSGD